MVKIYIINTLRRTDEEKWKGHYESNYVSYHKDDEYIYLVNIDKWSNADRFIKIHKLFEDEDEIYFPHWERAWFDVDYGHE